MTFARRVFTIAGIYGLLVMTPMLFAEPLMNAMGDPLTHPESHYGFVGVTLVFQLIFLLIGRDPLGLRPMMLAGVLEKAAFPAAAWPLFLMGRTPGIVAGFATVDLLLGVLFLVAWIRTRRVKAPAPAGLQARSQEA